MSSEKVLLWKPVSDEEQNAYLRYTKVVLIRQKIVQRLG